MLGLFKIDRTGTPFDLCLWTEMQYCVCGFMDRVPTVETKSDKTKAKPEWSADYNMPRGIISQVVHRNHPECECCKVQWRSPLSLLQTCRVRTLRYEFCRYLLFPLNKIIYLNKQKRGRFSYWFQLNHVWCV